MHCASQETISKHVFYHMGGREVNHRLPIPGNTRYRYISGYTVDKFGPQMLCWLKDRQSMNMAISTLLYFSRNFPKWSWRKSLFGAAKISMIIGVLTIKNQNSNLAHVKMHNLFFRPMKIISLVALTDENWEDIHQNLIG